MAFSAEEQYMLELINRARLDPDAEAARQGIGLNDGLAAGTITSAAKGVLAPNDKLELAAEYHTDWMLANETYGHIGDNDSLAGGRMKSFHYPESDRFFWGENVTAIDMADASSQTDAVDRLFKNLMLNVTDPDDRRLLFHDAPQEIGFGLEFQTFTITTLSQQPPFYSPVNPGDLPSGQSFSAALLTANYGKRDATTPPADVFLTGVAYADGDHDNFYSIGEGTSGVGFAIGGNATVTAAAGGYALKLAPAAGVGVAVTASGGAVSTVVVDLSAGNVKLDLVDGTLFRSSGSLTLVSGVAAAELLGVADLTLTGNALANRLAGNRGHNVLTGLDGNDSLSGGAGNDTLYGGNNYDTIRGGDGDDRAWGGNGRDLVYLDNGNDVFWDNGQNDANGHDTIWGGAGNDTVNGGGGNEVIWGEAGADSLLGGIGNDTIYAGDNYDTIRGGDGDDQAWGGNGRDLVFLGNGNDIFWDNGQNDANGHDTIWGGAGNDTVNGGGGNEVIYGEAGDDSLLGGIGNDTLWGGTGNDTLTGGNGADRFVFATGHGSDVITDFENGIDVIRLATGAADFSAVTVTAQGSDTLVQFSDVSILLAGVDSSLIDASDFIFG
jgi:Ca2+-binding RTX toxin-like protein